MRRKSIGHGRIALKVEVHIAHNSKIRFQIEVEKMLQYPSIS